MIIGIDVWRAFLDDKTGTERYSYEILKALLGLEKSRQHQFRLYCKKIDQGFVVPDWAKTENVVIKEINWPRLWTQGGLAIECLIRPPDVLFIPAHTLPLIRRPRLKTVVTIHGLEYQYLPEYYQFPQKLYLNKSTEMVAKYADRIIAVSQWTKKQLIEQLGAKASKIKVIHEGVGDRFVKRQSNETRGVNKQWLRQIKKKYQLGERYILFVGTIQPRKNLVRLIEALAGIKDKKIDLVIAGKKGWMYQEILKAPSRLGVANRVKFVGRVADADLPAIYAGAEIFAWPSLMEGFGLPVLEAMAMGIPVVTSNRGALPEVAGKAALLVEPEQTADLVKAIDLLIDNQDLRQGLREKGYRQVKKFSWEKAAEKTLKLLTTVETRGRGLN